MKRMLPLLCALLLNLALSPLSAREFSAKTAAWNDLSKALEITPFYFTLKDPAEARSLRLEIEIYKDGKLLQTVTGGGLSQGEPSAIDYKSAVFFLPAKDATIPGIISSESNRSSSKSHFSFPADIIPGTGMCSGALHHPNQPLAIPGKTPLYALVYPAPDQPCSLPNDWQKTIKTNPGAAVFIFFLEAE